MKKYTLEQVKELLSDFVDYFGEDCLKYNSSLDCYTFDGYLMAGAVKIKKAMIESGKFKDLSVKRDIYCYGFGTICFNIK